MILFLLVFFLFIGIVLNHLYLWKPRDMSLFYNGNRPLWFAHRGASSTAPENTISAFTQAVKNGMPALEIDVVRTSDGVLLCSHNFDLEWKTDSNGYIDEMSYNEIKRFIMFYQRITLQMITDLSKSASVFMLVKKNHEIKKVLFKS